MGPMGPVLSISCSTPIRKFNVAFGNQLGASKTNFGYNSGRIKNLRLMSSESSGWVRSEILHKIPDRFGDELGFWPWLAHPGG